MLYGLFTQIFSPHLRKVSTGQLSENLLGVSVPDRKVPYELLTKNSPLPTIECVSNPLSVFDVMTLRQDLMEQSISSQHSSGGQQRQISFFNRRRIRTLREHGGRTRMVTTRHDDVHKLSNVTICQPVRASKDLGLNTKRSWGFGNSRNLS